MKNEQKIAKFFRPNSLTPNKTLLNLYVSVFTFILPILALYQILGFVEILEVDLIQKIQGITTIIATSYLLIFKNKNSTAYAVIYIHYGLLLLLTLTSVYWYSYEPGIDSMISMFFIVITCGIIVIDPVPTVVYFLLVLIALITLRPSTEMMDIKLIFYFVLIAVLIIIFAFWRDQLISNKNKIGLSYKNIFSDLGDQVFVLDMNFRIIELNKSAQEFVENRSQISPVGRKFLEVFCTNDNSQVIIFKNAIDELQHKNKVVFEILCALSGTNDYVPKEFTLRRSDFLEDKVYILTSRSLKNQREFEKKLIESKENISRVLENINSFVYNITYDQNGNHTINYVSPKVKEVFGVESDEYITLVKSGRLNELFYPADREEAVLMFNDVVNTIKDNRIKFRIIRNHEVRWIEERIYPQKSDDSKINLFGIITDITDQIEATDKLEQSEKRYRQMFERNMAGVYKIHLDGTILDANPAFAKILGYDSVFELKKENIRNLYYYGPDRTGYIDRLRKEGHLNNYISVLRRKDGKKLILNNNVSLQNDEDGNPALIEGTLIDITDIEETANALKVSESKYKSLFEDSSEGIILIEFENDQEKSRIIDANKTVCTLLGYSKNEILSLSVADIAKYKHALINLLRTHDNTNRSRIEWVFKKKDDTAFLAEINYVQILGHDKFRIQMVIQDISERKRNEEILKESQESFKNIVDNSPLSILIFTNEKLVYSNPNGENLLHDTLSNKSTNLYEVFPKNLKHVLRDLISETNNTGYYTQFELLSGSSQKQFSLSVVKTIYLGQRSDMFILQDITLQTEYHNQRLRAEIAEEINVQLKNEIESHKRTQAELTEKTYWLNAVFESSRNLFILALDDKYRIKSFNANFKNKLAKDLGVEVKTGDTFLSYFNISSENKAKIEERFQRAFKGETLELISHYPAVDREVYIESFLNPIRTTDNVVNEISFISHEITEKIEIERKIKESEANNRAILLALPDAIMTVDREGRFLDFKLSDKRFLDPIAARLNTTDVSGHNLHDLIEHDDIGVFIDLVKEVLDTGQLKSHTFKIKNEIGRTVFFENRFSKLNDNEVIVLARNVTDTMEYESMLVESLKEKEILLKEVHHRVKNNLQVINSILNLQSSYVEDSKTLEIINESQNRIRSMSYIHESLYQTKDFSSINFSDYITNLIQNLVHSYQIFENKIDLELQIEPVQLALDQAIPCGLILNELVSNALKYAYPDKDSGKIIISVSEKNNIVNIGVEDFGIGLPANFSIATIDSLGLSLVHTLVDQLDGHLEFKTLGGTKFLITFEKQEI